MGWLTALPSSSPRVSQIGGGGSLGQLSVIGIFFQFFHGNSRARGAHRERVFLPLLPTKNSWTATGRKGKDFPVGLFVNTVVGLILATL